MEPTLNHEGGHQIISRSKALVIGSIVIGLVVIVLSLAPELRAHLASAIALDNRTRFGVDTHEGSLAVGKPAPDFTLKTLNGDEITLSSLRGQAVLVNFWASWCGPCQQEIPELVRSYQMHKSDGLVILALNKTASDSLKGVDALAKEFDPPFPILLDENDQVSSKLYQVPGLPMSVFIDRDGSIQRIHLGVMTGEQIDSFVSELLK